MVDLVLPMEWTASQGGAVTICGSILATVLHSMYAPMLFTGWSICYSASGVRDARGLAVYGDNITVNGMLCMLLSAMAAPISCGVADNGYPNIYSISWCCLVRAEPAPYQVVCHHLAPTVRPSGTILRMHSPR